MTRTSSPDPVLPVAGQQHVDTFQTPSCPEGYAQVADFNSVPAIEYLINPQTIFGPFTSMAEFLSYKNDSSYWCSIYLTGYNAIEYPGQDVQGNQTPTPTLPAGLENDFSITPILVGTAPSGHYGGIGSNQTTTTYNNYYTTYADGKAGYCSHGGISSGGSQQPDNPPTYDVDIENINSSGRVGQWMRQLTWSYFWNNLGGTISGNWSFTSGSNCQWAFSSNVIHDDWWYHYYRLERCQYSSPSGWFYTPKSVPGSHVCARIKPTWMKTN